MRIAAPKKYIAPMEVAIKSFQYNRKNIAFLNWISNYCGIRVAKSEFHQNETKIINFLSPIKNTIVDRCLSLVAVKIQNHRGTQVFPTFLWNYGIFFMKLSGFFYQTIENCNNILVNLRRQAHVFQLSWICAEFCWIWAKKFFFFYNCETVISFIFF